MIALQPPEAVADSPVQLAAVEYTLARFAIARILPGEKRPTLPGWSKRSEPAENFQPGDGIGIVCGPISAPKGYSLVCIDLDSADAIARADEFLPITTMIDGRASKPKRHRAFWVPNDSVPHKYRSTAKQAASHAIAAFGHPGPRTESFRHSDGKEAFRLIGTGGQFNVPPTLHASGEIIEWEPNYGGSPAIAEYTILREACVQLAAAIGADAKSKKSLHQVHAVASNPSPAFPQPASSGENLHALHDSEKLSEAIRRATNWSQAVGRDDPPKSGSGGDAKTIRILGKLLFGFRLPRDVALKVFLDEINLYAVPPWTLAELQRKIDWLITRGSHPDFPVGEALRAEAERSVYPSDNTDLANSRRFVQHSQGKLLFCGSEKEYRYYDPESGVWKRDSSRRAEHEAKLVVDRMIRDAAENIVTVRRGVDAKEPTEAQSKQLKSADHRLKWALESAKNYGRITSMVRLASSDPGFQVEPDDFDADSTLFNALNGVVDLTNGKLFPHSPGLLLSKCAATAFDPAAACTSWDAFCLSIFGGDTTLVNWIQRWFGYCLSGDVSIQLLPVFWGHGRNGKSTFMDTLAAVVGEYWGKAAPDLMLSKRGEAHPAEVADLHGMRLAFTVESDEGRKLNEARIKEFTGDATLKARRMRENFYEFRRQFKLILVTNHKPAVETGGDAIWRRLRLVPFNQRYWDSDRGESGPAELKADRELPAKLLAERNGILAWLVRGAVAVYGDGMKLGSCGAIENETRRYEAAEDTFKQFIAEQFKATQSDSDEVLASDVRDSYQRWAAENGAKPLSPRAITEKLLQLGTRRRQSHGKTIYVGLARLTEGG
jgi:P4 family phage/plasmid primase-like protien